MSASRATRSRSRGPTQAPSESTVPAAASATAAAASAAAAPSSSKPPRAPPAAVPSPSPAPSTPASSPGTPLPFDNKYMHVQTGNGRKDATRQASDQEFFWCEGEPTLRKVAAHLDTLTGSEQQLRARQNSLTESFAALNSTVQALSDSNQRLRRELRNQKSASTRRYMLGAVALLAMTLGAPHLRAMFVGLVWALERPLDAFPVLMQNLHVLSGYLWILAFPLTLALFLHKQLASYGASRIGLTRTVIYLVLGLGMQLPLLQFLWRSGAAYLTQLPSDPLFHDALLNHMTTTAIFAAMCLLDYILIVLHQYI